MFPFCSCGRRDDRRGIRCGMAHPRTMRLWPCGHDAEEVEPRVYLPRQTRHGDAGLDARSSLPAGAIGKSASPPEVRIAGMRVLSYTHSIRSFKRRKPRPIAAGAQDDTARRGSPYASSNLNIADSPTGLISSKLMSPQGVVMAGPGASPQRPLRKRLALVPATELIVDACGEHLNVAIVDADQVAREGRARSYRKGLVV